MIEEAGALAFEAILVENEGSETTAAHFVGAARPPESDPVAAAAATE